MLWHERLTQWCGNGWSSLSLVSRTTRRLIRRGGVANRLMEGEEVCGGAPCCMKRKHYFWFYVSDWLLEEKKGRKSRSDPKAAQETLEAQFVKFTFCRVTGCITPVSSWARLPFPTCACVCVRRAVRGILCVHVGSCKKALQWLPDEIKSCH